MAQTPSTRWCPTPEQRVELEEMYRSGLHNPDVSQIQLITTYLSYYGKIEGKNVFYWFQNHRARERQMLRERPTRQLLLHADPTLYNNHLIHTFQEPPLHLQQGGAQDAEQAMNLNDGVIGMMNGVGNCFGYEAVLHPRCRPPITLDLFPCKSTTGLRDACSSSSSAKNSSCSTSTNL